MATREIVMDERAPGGKFTKIGEVFVKVGDKFTALYEKSVAAQTSSYGGTDITWQLKDGSTTVMTVNRELESTLAKAKLQPGEKVTITLIKLIPPTKPGFHAQRVFGNPVVDDSTVKNFKSALQEESAPEASDEASW